MNGALVINKPKGLTFPSFPSPEAPASGWQRDVL